MGFLGRLGTGIRKSFSGTASFFNGSVAELKKVRWPSRKELTSYTIVVIVTVLFLTLFFAVIDLGITQLTKLVTG
ncbi:preprotein translocase subunit SecE [Mechercharimyces sp. CAU 1602]|uniref:preprotein translocase subunit SecE n=1 Tax=Mechercharimyces sp. CAU 1602 TaxID=2973933 RepID=UPI0021613E90|nr:preprotein translocase subunit SecE [Mechercharimyces sp. CAU 1602]MCS1352519.1 preprotein translocase subunit SecE [Mechercharimyces sp. CAU 1602]